MYVYKYRHICYEQLMHKSSYIRYSWDASTRANQVQPRTRALDQLLAAAASPALGVLQAAGGALGARAAGVAGAAGALLQKRQSRHRGVRLPYVHDTIESQKTLRAFETLHCVYKGV